MPWWWAAQQDPRAKLRLKREAVGYINHALALSPDLAEAHAAMGMVQSDARDGQAWLERAVRLDPQDVEAWIWLGNARKAESYDLRGALQAYRRAQALEPAWQRANEPLLTLLMRLEGTDRALAELQRFSAAVDNQVWPHKIRASLLLGSGRLAEAADQAAASLAATPQNPWWARSILLTIAHQLGNRPLESQLLRADPSLRALLDPYTTPGYAFARAKSRPDGWWDGNLMGAQAAQLVSEGNSATLAGLYDRAFSSPSAFVQSCPCDVLAAGPPLVLALRQMRRETEARQLVAALREPLRRLAAQGDRAPQRLIAEARLASVAGDDDIASNLFRDAVNRGWRGQDAEYGADPATDPALARIRSHAGFRQALEGYRAAIKSEAARLAAVEAGEMTPQ